jgi:DegT/DnrJ/EryC1/StrS aminotransferase family
VNVLVPESEDLYRSPRYDETIARDLHASVGSDIWDDWDLDGLLYEVPHAFAKKIGRRHGIFCSTGTAGLHAALMSLPLVPGDEVIVPVMTFIRAVTPLVHLGLVPVLADIDPETGNLDPAGVVQAIGPKTKAVLVVHMWGVVADLRGLLELCADHSLYLLEDFSHAHLSRHVDGYAGSFGDVSFASMQRKKVLSVGEGGLILTDDDDVYSRLQQITSPGSFKGTPYFREFSGFGLNLRMSPFSMVVAKALLGHADEIVAGRARHAEVFDQILKEFEELENLIYAPVKPSYVERVSAYGYKPYLGNLLSLEYNLKRVNRLGRWQFTDFNYDNILKSVFWGKDGRFFPFSSLRRPRVMDTYPGYDRYMRGRISVGVPTVSAAYWTPERIDQWRNEAFLTILPRSGR